MLDTNAFPSGPRSYRKPLLSVDALESLAEDAAAEGVEIWVPEVVLWELAQHACEFYGQQFGPWRSAARRLSSGGVAVSEPVELTAAQIIEQTEAAARQARNVRVIGCRAESARQGLRDQVLQTGAATVDQGVKTGAADGTWVRDILAEAGGSTKFHLVTSDADPGAAFASMDVEPPTIHKSIRALRTAVFVYEDTGADQAVAEVLRLLNDPDVWDERIQMREPELDALIQAEIPPGVVQVEVFPVMPFKVLGVSDVRVTKMRGTVSAGVVLAATFELEGWNVTPEGALTHAFSTTYDGGVMAGEFVFGRWDGELSSARADDIVVAHGRRCRYNDSADAKDEVLRWLIDYVPGVATFAAEMSQGGDIEISVADGGVDLRVEDSPMGWRLTVEDKADGSSCAVECTYEDSVFVGGSREGEVMEPPYVVSASPDDVSLGRPTWAATAFLLDRLQRDFHPRLPKTEKR